MARVGVAARPEGRKGSGGVFRGPAPQPLVLGSIACRPRGVTTVAARAAGAGAGGAAAGGKKVSMDMKRREQRNAREKERSCRVANQIDDLRTLLSRGGVIVAKGTKSSVLSEAATYINLLQQQQVQWEM